MTIEERKLRLEVLETYAETGNTSLLDDLQESAIDDKIDLGVEFGFEQTRFQYNPLY